VSHDDGSGSSDRANVEVNVSSCAVTSSADDLLRDAILTALGAEPDARAEVFAKLLHDIEEFMGRRPQERPWTYSIFTGPDGSQIFRGGTGRSIVIDPFGTMWKARSYEDFDTAYTITETDCTIASLTPRYEEMRRYFSPAAGLLETHDEEDGKVAHAGAEVGTATRPSGTP
jgi:hypothetical protein